jgi:hypothetical protein
VNAHRLTIVALWLCLLLVTLAPSASSAHAVSKKCAVAAAGGHAYNVSAISVSCSFADRWVAALAGKRLAANVRNVRISGGPKGFTCEAGTKTPSVAMPDIKPNVQIAGNCAKGPGGLGGFGGAPYFNWVVVQKG